MISYLRMENFRRHASTELRFEDSGQVVLIAGRNGAGKSSIIEAIVFALYGVGRNGNRWLDRMVRRGGELEGMEVELEFDCDDVRYRVTRRLDNRYTSALLFGNDIALCEGSREVTAEVTRIFGMDAQGFKLAVVAQQKELDGLASKRPAERSAMLSRLLRLDAVTSAKDAARSRFRQEQHALRGLGAVDGLDEIELEITKIEAAIESGRVAVGESEVAVTLLDAELAAGAGLEAAYSEANAILARAEGLAESARGERDRIARELDKIEIIEVDVSKIDIEELQLRSQELGTAIASGEAAAQVAAQAAATRSELASVEERLGALQAEFSEAELDEEGALKRISEAEAELTARQEEVSRQTQEFAGASATLEVARRRLEHSRGLGATCDECGQVIGETHRHTQLHKNEAEVANLEAAVASWDVAKAQADYSAARARLNEARTYHARVLVNKRTVAERSDLERRATTYRGQLDRLVIHKVDLEALYEERGNVESELASSRSLLDQHRMAEMLKERRGEILTNWRAAVVRCEEAASDVEQAAIDANLVGAHARLSAQRESRSIENDILSGLREDLARHQERLTGLTRERQLLQEKESRRRDLETSGVVASLTSEVLDKIGTHLNQQLRPQLEGGIADLLSRMSDGRFDAVRVDEAYAISVRDDGEFRPLSEFSGGEIDLIALSVRLALASVVSERRGGGGVGFLILDECFGSQDVGRQGSVMTVLRSLRASHGQILLISHVGGLEDDADVVVEVSVDEVTGLSSAKVN